MTQPALAPRDASIFKERWQVVQDDIRDRILSGEFRPGSPIKEVEIAESLGVSRGPVREAIRALEVSGLVSRRPQRTSIVTPITKRDVDELYSLRESIEDLAIVRSMSKHRAELTADITDRLSALTAAFASKADIAAIARLDIGLHGAFYEWADHSRLAATWATISDSFMLLMAYTNSGLTSSRRNDAGHREIVAAVAAGDSRHVRRLSSAHMHEGRDRILALVE